MNDKFLTMLDNARDIAGVPFRINSGYRCEDHNIAVGGSKTSSHLKGMAADIETPNDYYRFRIRLGLLKAGFTRLGTGSNFIHVDNDPNKNHEREWVY